MIINGTWKPEDVLNPTINEKLKCNPTMEILRKKLIKETFPDPQHGKNTKNFQSMSPRLFELQKINKVKTKAS